MPTRPSLPIQGSEPIRYQPPIETSRWGSWGPKLDEGTNAPLPVHSQDTLSLTSPNAIISPQTIEGALQHSHIWSERSLPKLKPYDGSTPVTRGRMHSIHQSARTKVISHGSAHSSHANADDDWTKISDLVERRRIQNRIAQRAYRSRLKKRQLFLESRIAEIDAPKRMHGRYSPSDHMSDLQQHSKVHAASSTQAHVKPGQSFLSYLHEASPDYSLPIAQSSNEVYPSMANLQARPHDASEYVSPPSDFLRFDEPVNHEPMEHEATEYEATAHHDFSADLEFLRKDVYPELADDGTVIPPPVYGSWN